MNQEQSHAFAADCYHGEYASCSYACPFRLDIRSMMDKVRAGKFQSAYRQLRETLVFPDIVSELCEAPCMGHCVRKMNGRALSVPQIEKAVSMYAKSKDPKDYNIPAKSKNVAVIGAGASGLACALRLAVKKYNIDVYEQSDQLGGILRTHEKADVFIAEINRQIQKEKINFHFGTKITDLGQICYDAVYVATGRDGDDFGLMDSWNEKSYATSAEACFIGGMKTGSSVVDAIAQGVIVSRQIEKYLLAGSVQDYEDDFPYENCERYLCTEQVTDEPAVVAADNGIYSAEEASLEASRCLQCDCSKCMDSCEMLKHFKKSPQKIVKEIYTDSIVLHGMSKRTLTREVAACNMCGQCRHECPTSVDMGAAFLFARRDRAAAGNYPKAFHEFWLSQMDISVNEASVLKLPSGKDKCAYLFFPGCQLGSSDPDYVSMTYDYLAEHTGDDTGLMLTCCGAPAYWAGEEALHGQVTDRIREFWKASGSGTVICACMTCMKVFRELMPEIPVISLYEVMQDMADDHAKVSFEGAVFDPCSARDNEGARTAVRGLLNKVGVHPAELPFHDEKAKCCGWGGHIYPANRELFDQIVGNRVKAADLPYIVYCSNCRDVFASAGKDCVHILDLFFALRSDNRKAPTIKEKYDNSIRLKKTLLENYWNEEYKVPEFEGDDMDLILSDEIKKKLEMLLLSEDILRKAIAKAEADGDKFVNETEGYNICSYEEGLCTIWVHYRAADPENTYEVRDVYMHRMKIVE